MTKIYFPNAWGENNVLNMFIHQSPNNKGVWGDIEAVTNKNEADYIVVQDNTSENVDYSKVIFFGREPSYIQGINPKWVKNKCFRFFHHSKNNSWMPQTWWLGVDYSTLLKMENFKKTKNLSMIESGKRMASGHIKRNNILREIIKKYPNDIDVYGKICRNRKNIKPYKTILPHRKKEKGLLEYRYNLAIENGSTDYYFSEKIVDPLLCWTMPIYWGCKKIDKFLPKESYILLDMNKKGVAEEIIKISKSDIREKNIDYIKEAREVILNKYNLWPSIERSIKNEKML